jgi:hypothetical protein
MTLTCTHFTMPLSSVLDDYAIPLFPCCPPQPPPDLLLPLTGGMSQSCHESNSKTIHFNAGNHY